jgi:hypothetical protein
MLASASAPTINMGPTFMLQPQKYCQQRKGARALQDFDLCHDNLVASPAARDLLVFAKYLFVAAMRSVERAPKRAL